LIRLKFEVSFAKKTGARTILAVRATDPMVGKSKRRGHAARPSFGSRILIVRCAMCETFYSTTLRTACTVFTFPFIHWIYLVFYLKRLHRNRRVSEFFLLEQRADGKSGTQGWKSGAQGRKEQLSG